MGLVTMLVLVTVFKTAWETRVVFGGFDSHTVPPIIYKRFHIVNIQIDSISNIKFIKFLEKRLDFSVILENGAFFVGIISLKHYVEINHTKECKKMNRMLENNATYTGASVRCT